MLNEFVDKPRVNWYVADLDVGNQIGEQGRRRIHKIHANIGPCLLEIGRFRFPLHTQVCFKI